MGTFKDNFSKQSDLYVRYRPHYPAELFAYLSSLTEDHDLAWDCGTGNGQAALGLAKFFDRVIATDPSKEQIKNAVPHAKVTYKVEKAENNSVLPSSVDLLTVANALHWFDFEIFYKEVKRVLKKNGVIAAWAYGPPSVSPAIDKILNHYHDHTLNDYWLAENRLVEKRYTTIPFPFDEIKNPEFYSEKTMDLNDFIGFLNTWSATQRFISQNNFNPTDEVRDNLKLIWKNDEIKKINWKLVLKVGRV